MSIQLLFILSLFPLSTFSQTQASLKEILSHQFQNKKQSKLLQNKAQEQIYKTQIYYSPWLTEVSSSLERKFSITERFTGAATNITDSLPWRSGVDQRTPYGFNLSLEYYKELDKPAFQNLFQEERLKGTVSFSLYADLLGASTRSVFKGQQKYEGLIKRDTLAKNCVDISKQYLEAAALETELEIIKDSIRVVKNLHKQVKRAVRRGALSVTDKISLEVDLNNLEVRRVLSKKQLLDARLRLEEVSNFVLADSVNLNLSQPVKLVLNKIRYERVEIAKEELKNIKKQSSKLRLESGKDIKLYGGVESTKFTQNTINVEGETDFSFIGIQALWRFGDTSLNRERERLKVLSSIKTVEMAHLERREKEREVIYKADLNSLKVSYDAVLKTLKASGKLERKAVKNFKNGKARFSEFLSTRNQINSLKSSEINLKKNFWNRYTEYLYLTGDFKKLCASGG